MIIGFQNIQEHCQTPTDEGERSRDVESENINLAPSKSIGNPMEILSEYLLPQPLVEAAYHHYSTSRTEGDITGCARSAGGIRKYTLIHETGGGSGPSRSDVI